MLKLDKSKAVNNIALHLDTDASIDNIIMVYSQSYDLSNGTMDMVVDETKGKYRIGGISGSAIPSPSGQYNIDIFEGDEIPAVWNQVAVEWDAYNERWDDAGEFGITGSLLRTIRAFISGSNDSSFTDYESPNELGTYTTYNG